MNFDLLITGTVAFVVVATAVLAPPPNPRPKPEVPIVSEQTSVEKSLAECAKHPDQMCFVQAEPSAQSAVDQQNVTTARRDLSAAKRDVEEIKRVLKEQQAAKRGDDGT